MSDLFRPIASEQLIEWVFSELETRDSVFGIPRQLFFVPSEDDPFRATAFGRPLETPFGPAAGPHSQMAQNIVAAWLCGARYIELKTVQTLDVLEVSKPCIDMEDEGYNVEWSQELRIRQSFQEYLRAWVLIHALHRKLDFPGETPGVLFNLSVGYDLDGIRKPNMQWFLDRVSCCADEKQNLVEQVARFFPQVTELDIPDRLSDNVTLSTMHGCPPGEIGKICAYLMESRRLHTFVKCNPTLLGPDRVRAILHQDLGFRDPIVPDDAFQHDLSYAEALPLLTSLRATADRCGLEFGVKLSNTLQVENFRTVFNSSEEMMYLSGRPLHAITVNLAADLSESFAGNLPMSFSAGADCFNSPRLLAAGMQTITVCSDLLKTGGYLRLRQYLENTAQAMRQRGAARIGDFILKTAAEDGAVGGVRESASGNLRRYARRTLSDRLLKKDRFHTSGSKTGRELGLFDCIEAPCTDRCAVDQKVPQYMEAVRQGDLQTAVSLTRDDNPLASMLSRICDHLCEPACVRTHLDEPLAIRHVKRFIMDQERHPASEEETAPHPADSSVPATKVAVIGAGPGGIAAAIELARAGIEVEVFEKHPYAGGMVGGAIPAYRLPAGVLDRDLGLLESLGVPIHFGQTAGQDIFLGQLRREGFSQIVIAAGAQLGKKLGLPGEDCEGVMDALHFLRRCRENQTVKLGRRIGIIGAGDTAMDCARTAWRLTGAGSDGKVSVIYRRTIDQMPADREEIACLLEEGIEVVEMARPAELHVEHGRLCALHCQRMEYRGDRDASGRKIPHVVEDSGFDIPLDTLILAISQHAILDFFDDEPIAVNRRGYIAADPETFETSAPGVYAGGDVVNDGPSSIVEAAADGKAIARSILTRDTPPEPVQGTGEVDTVRMLARRSHRQWRVPIPHVPVRERNNFNEVVGGYSAEQAGQEAGRCLDCDRYCSLCVGVCPNFALQTLPVQPLGIRLPEITSLENEIHVEPGRNFQVRQRYQIIVLADFCNECGNCSTFCPTAGDPYRDKPRLCFDREEFEAHTDNAFMAFRASVKDGQSRWVMDGRWSGEKHRIELSDRLNYSGPLFSACMDPDTFQPSEIETKETPAGTEPFALEACATMYVLLKNLAQFLPHLPYGGRIPGLESADRR